MADSPRKVVEDVLSGNMTRAIWSGNYDEALPVSLHRFDFSTVLPAVFYMFRFGHRRGSGQFLNIFGDSNGTPAQKRKSATIERVADKLATMDGLEGFGGEVEQAILGDLLLCFCLENTNHNLGRDQQIQRVAPAHYMASWIDLPQNIAHLRNVPEMMVAMLAAQKGEVVTLNQKEDKTRFAVGRGYGNNVLLKAFNRGMTQIGYAADLASDRFNEADGSVGLDQLLMIRLAQQLPRAPDKQRGKQQRSRGSEISNQRPIAERAARQFSEDIRRFVRSYADPLPRHSLVEVLESAMAVGLTTILTSTIEMLLQWAENGKIVAKKEQAPAQLFVDCSNGIDRSLRGHAEQSMDDVMRRMERFPAVLMVLRILDYQARSRRKIKQQNIATRPYATAWLNLLGKLLMRRHEEARFIQATVEGFAEKLAEKLEDDYPETADILTNADSQPDPVWRLAEGLMTLVGPNVRRSNFMAMIDSSLLTDRPNGLAQKRSTTRGTGGNSARRSRIVRSLVFTDPVLEYLVHLLLLKTGNKAGIRPLSFKDFIKEIRERYGLCVDTPPRRDADLQRTTSGQPGYSGTASARPRPVSRG